MHCAQFSVLDFEGVDTYLAGPMRLANGSLSAFQPVLDQRPVPNLSTGVIVWRTRGYGKDKELIWDYGQNRSSFRRLLADLELESCCKVCIGPLITFSPCFYDIFFKLLRMHHTMKYL